MGPYREVPGSPITRLALLALVVLTSVARAAPPNDECVDATVIAASPFTDTEDTRSASTAADEPTGCYCRTAPNTVWYSFTPTAPVTVTVGSAGSDYQNVIDVYDDGCASVYPFRCNHPAQDVVFSGCPGRTYLFRVSSAPVSCLPGGGTLVLHVTASGPPPDHDGDGLDDCNDN